MRQNPMMKLGLALLLCFAGALARSQGDPSERVISPMEYRNADIHLVLSDLFKRANTHFIVGNAIQGKMSLRLPQLTFERALQTILRSCSLTYRVENQCYEVILRDGPVPTLAASPVFVADASLRHGAQDEQPPRTEVHAASGVKSDLQQLFMDVFSQTGSYYVLGIGVKGVVSLDVPSMPMNQMVGLLAASGDSSAQYRDRIWIVSGPFRGSSIEPSLR